VVINQLTTVLLLFEFGKTPWYHYEAEDSTIPKMPVINSLQALVHPQTKKKTILHGLSIPNPNFSKFAFLANTSAE
jgi:hypothetical protein